MRWRISCTSISCTSISCVRTTLDLDEDVLMAVKERARRERRSAGKVMSDLAREGLVGQRVVRGGSRRARYGFDPLPPRGGVVTNELIDRLRDRTVPDGAVPGAGPEHLGVL